MTVLYIMLALLGVIAVLSLLLSIIVKKLKKANAEVQRLSGAFEAVRKRAERLQEAQSKNKKIMEESDEKRQSLSATADASLVTRANTLFSDEVYDDKSADYCGH
ncbi:MAG: hypothetical protein ACTTH8_08335 [Treponema sp.]